MFMNVLKAFAHRDDGVIAILFGLLVFVLGAMLTLTIDTGRAINVSSKIQQATDATAIEVAKLAAEEGLRGGALEARAKEFFVTYAAGLSSKVEIDLDNFSANYDENSGRADISVDTVVKNAVDVIRAGHELRFTRTSQAVYSIRDIEMALVLDVTGSMEGAQLEALKTAATALATTMINSRARAQRTRIALAPYAQAVNLGAYANDATHVTTPSPDGCVSARLGFAAYTDHSPNGAAAFPSHDPDNGRTLVDHDTSVDAVAPWLCPTATIRPLTSNITNLTTSIAAYTANGGTAGHIGLAWGWYMLSPSWRHIFTGSAAPAEYDRKKTLKYILLMTDGVFNTAWMPSDETIVPPTSTERATLLCDAVKSEGVFVFSVALEDPLEPITGTDTETFLRGCASTPTGEHPQTFFMATTPDELLTAFASVAKQVNTIRVTN